MQSYSITNNIDRGKAETVLFKMGLCLWICRDPKLLLLLAVPFTVKCSQ